MISNIVLVLFVVVALLMTFLILLQEGKGGGLAALGGTKAAGVEGVTNPIRRATGYLAAMFFVLAIVLAAMHRPDKTGFKGEEASAAGTEKKVDALAAPNMGGAPITPVAPMAPAPAGPAPILEKKVEPAKDVKPEAKPDETKAPAPLDEKKDEAKAPAAPAPTPAAPAPAAAPKEEVKAPAPVAPVPVAPAVEEKKIEEKKDAVE